VNHLPNWNKPGSFSAGRDPLGLQAASVRLYTDLLPGLTNVTNRLRYFSFYCWVVRQFELRRHSSVERIWSLFIRRAEAAYVLASHYGDDEYAFGMAGSIWAGRHSGLDRALDFRPWTDQPGEDDQYLKARFGNFGQFYIASMQQVGMLQESPLRVQAVKEGLGFDLAEAFEDACPTACKELLRAIDSGTIGPKDCRAISDEAHPAYLEDSEELRLLVEYLCGDRVEDPTAPARRATLWNVLNIVDRTGIVDPSELRRELYVQDNIGVVTEGTLAENLIGWRAYFVNELCHIALELLLNALTYRVNAAGPRRPDELTRDLVSKGLGADSNTSLSLLEFAIERSPTTLEEEHIAGLRLSQAVGTTVEPPDPLLTIAIDLLLALWERWGADPGVEAALKPATISGRSALGVFRFLDSLADQPAPDVLVSLTRKFVVSNHLLIAGQKLAAAGTYTYRFIVDEATLVDGLAAEYGFTNPRIGNLLTFAEDAGLVTEGELTPAGKTFLRANQSVR